MWVIVKFEESWFYKLSYFLSSSSTHPYTSPRGLCFLTFIPDNLKSNGKQLQIHKQAASQWQSSCHPIHMARSCDNLLLWQAYDIQGSASGVLVRDLFRPSDAPDSQGMSFFMRFCSRWNATRVLKVWSRASSAPGYSRQNKFSTLLLREIYSRKSDASQTYKSFHISDLATYC